MGFDLYKDGAIGTKLPIKFTQYGTKRNQREMIPTTILLGICIFFYNKEEYKNLAFTMDEILNWEKLKLILAPVVILGMLAMFLLRLLVKTTLTIDQGLVTYQRSEPLKAELRWQESLNNYKELLSEKRYHTGSSTSPAYDEYSITLSHRKDRAKNLHVWVTRTKHIHLWGKDVRGNNLIGRRDKLATHYSKLFNLPVKNYEE